MITGASPREASRALRDVLQRAIASVSTGVVSQIAVPPDTDLIVVQAVPSPVGAVNMELLLRFLLVSETGAARVERWRVRLVSYVYKLDAADGREILSYHWHPAGLSHERRPHLHLGAGFGAIRPEWQKAHLLTGPLSPAVVLEPLITHLGVPPRRADWAGTLAALAAALDDGG